MNTINAATNALALSDTRVVNVKAKIDGLTDITNEEVIDFTYSENFGDGTNLTIGASFCNSLSLNMYNTQNVGSMNDIQVWVGLQASETDPTTWIDLGKFYVTEVTSPDNYQILNIQAYDAMSLLESDYVPTVVMPNDINTIVGDICTQNTLPYEGTTLPNISVDQEYDDDGNPVRWSYRTWLGYIAGVCGTNAIINRDQELEFRWFSAPSIPSIAEDYQMLGGLIRNSQANNSITEFISGTSENPISAGTTGQSITFENPLMTQAILNGLATNLLPVTFMPCSLEWRCDPQYRVGDLLSVAEDGQTWSVPVMQNTLKVSGGLSGTVQANGLSLLKETAVNQAQTNAFEQVIGTTAHIVANNVVNHVAGDTLQHFWFNSTGLDTGAHITEVTEEEFTDPSDPNYQSGGNLLARSNGIAVRKGITELATMTLGGFEVNTDDGNGNLVNIAHLGYGAGTDSGGGTSDAPYYSLGIRGVGVVGNYSVAEGHGLTVYENGVPIDYPLVASGYCSHAEGTGTVSSGYSSHSEGTQTTASGLYSHSEGTQTIASGHASHSEGTQTTASGYDTHSEGTQTTASGYAAHSEGRSTTASGDYSHSEGYSSEASANYAHSQNRYTVADQPSQTAIGKYNTKNNTNNLFAIGNGTADNARSDAFTVDNSGNVVASGTITAEGHSTHIGYNNTGSGSVSVGHNAWTNLSSELTMSSGTWILLGRAEFASNSNGRRAVCWANTTSGTPVNATLSIHNQSSTTGSTTLIQTVYFLNTATTVKYRLRGFQFTSSGTNLTTTYEWSLIRIS